MDEVKPAARLPTVEHREPCESRGSRTDLGAPGGEIPPGDSPLATRSAEMVVGRFRGRADMATPAAGLVPVENDPKETLRVANCCIARATT